MKRIALFCALAAMISVIGSTSCTNNNTKNKEENKPQQEAVVQETPVVEEQTCLTAVENYMVDTLGSRYAEAEICIPYANIVKVDETNADDILVWGDFWVFNYDLSGDTLKTVSGGSHPGLMHVKKTDNGFEVTSFDAVVDGAGNLESAKKIFGENYDAFHAINSDEVKREENRLRTTAEYVKKHDIKATLCQDYGWPAQSLPME